MALNRKQIQDILKSPSKRNSIAKAAKLERRVRFHTELNTTQHDLFTETSEFLDWVKGLLPKDKFNVFLHLFTFPIPTVALIEDVYRELERVFYSRNSSSSYHFADSSMANDWKHYSAQVLKQPHVWKTEGWQVMKSAFNSVVIVDLPEKQTSSLPEPYFYFEPITNVVDYDSTDGVSINWIVVKKDAKTILVIDEISYQVYEIVNTTELKLINQSLHNLGYCPARFFWSEPISDIRKDIKRNPIVKVLSDLNWYLFFSTSKKHLDLYAPYPIYSAYEADCSFANNETGDYCDGGFLRNSQDHYIVIGNGGLQRCPVCAEKRVAGPGSFLEVPVPDNNGPDLRNPVQITTVDEKSLEYNVKECERLAQNIKLRCVGANAQVSEKEAINVDQIAANFENKTSVLVSLKSNFEQIQKFTDSTICRLRYGDGFVSMALNYGTEFYVFTTEQLYKKYATAKANGASIGELDSIIEQIIDTEYRDSPEMLQRMRIIKQIEPYRHLTIEEVLRLHEKNIASTEDVALKLNLSTYIDRFERENINIVDFGSKASFRDKIETITKTIKSYVEINTTGT